MRWITLLTIVFYSAVSAFLGRNTLPIRLHRIFSQAGKTDANILVKVTGQTDKGAGIAVHETMPMVIPNTLPGDIVVINLNQFKEEEGKTVSSNIVEIRKHSFQRARPKCLIADLCGGCQIQHQAYSAQLNFKRDLILSSFNQHTSTKDLQHLIQPVLGSTSTFNYRNKAQFAIQRDSKNKVVVGLYESNSNKVVDTKYCAIQHELVNEVLTKFRTFVNTYPVSVYNESTRTGSLRHIVFRIGFSTQEIMVCIVSATKKVEHIQAFVDSVTQIPQVKSVLLHYNPHVGDQVLGEYIPTSTSSANSDSNSGNGHGNGSGERCAGKRRSSGGPGTTGMTRAGTGTGSTSSTSSAGGACGTTVLKGRDYILDSAAGGVRVKVSLHSFTQANPLQALLLYGTVRNLLLHSSGSGSDSDSSDSCSGSRGNGYGSAKDSDGSDSSGNTSVNSGGSSNNSSSGGSRVVWDLYCGVGTIGMYLAKTCNSDTTRTTTNSNSSTNIINNCSDEDGASSNATTRTDTASVERVIGIESCLPSVQDAVANAKLNNIHNIQFIHAQAEDVLSSYNINDNSANSTIDTNPSNGKDGAVILNPPRKGCHRAVLDAVLKAPNIRTVIYVSCNPKTLARDLDVLLTGNMDSNTASNADNTQCKNTSTTERARSKNASSTFVAANCVGNNCYEVKCVQPVDMFPHTVHVETVVWLERV